MGRIEGDLAVMPLADLAIWLANRRHTGRLTLEQGADRTVFDVADGMVLRTASHNPRHYFGQHLVHLGLLTEDQLQRAFGTQRETNVLLGRILVMIGIVPEEQVIQTLRVKFAEDMLDGFLWKMGRFVFDTDAEEEVRLRVDVAVPIVDIHREGLARAETWAEFERLVPGTTSVFSVHEDRLPPGLPAGSLDARLVERARLGLSVEAITLDLHATDFQVAAGLVKLIQQGVLQPREPSVTIDTQQVSGDLAEEHLDRARHAVGREDYLGALAHIEAGAHKDPRNPAFGELRRRIDGLLHDQSVPARSAVPVMARPLDPQASRRMSAKERYLLSRIDGRRDVSSIIQVSPMHDLEALQIIRQLEERGIVELVPGAPDEIEVEVEF